MEFTNDQIAAIIGTKELEIIGLRMRIAALEAELKTLSPPEPDKKLESVK